MSHHFSNFANEETLPERWRNLPRVAHWWDSSCDPPSSTDKAHPTQQAQRVLQRQRTSLPLEQIFCKVVENKGLA